MIAPIAISEIKNFMEVHFTLKRKSFKNDRINNIQQYLIDNPQPKCIIIYIIEGTVTHASHGIQHLVEVGGG